MNKIIFKIIFYNYCNGYVNPIKLTSQILNETILISGKGFLLVDNLLETKILHNAIGKINEIFPFIDNIDEVNNIAKKQDFGSNGKLEFLVYMMK